MALVVAFIFGEGLDLKRGTEIAGFIFFPVGICLGMLVAWWHEGIGGAITAFSLIVFYSIHYFTSGTFPRGAAWIVFAFPGFLFLLYWAGLQKERKPQPRATPSAT
jgi:hypothetical protein